MKARLGRLRKWLVPGIGIKRWLLLTLVGLFVFTGGILMIADVPANFYWKLRVWAGSFPLRNTIGSGFVVLGAVVMITALWSWFNTIYRAVVPYQQKQLVEVLYERRQLDHGLKLVAIGGGTGLASLLRGLKPFTSNLVAVVTVSDDGGSSGRLSKELGVLPPGDIRNCLVALADDESLLSELFRFRFRDGGLEGHSFGNLFLAALSEIAGDFEVAVKLSSQILATRGRVLPATLSPVTLCARFVDGSTVRGESAIPRERKLIESVFIDPELCRPPAEVLAVLAEADAIVLGPGSLYTSVIPNLLVEGVVDALRHSSAPKIYVCNVMTQPGETDGKGAADHLEAIAQHAGARLIDYALVNLAVPQKLLHKYRARGAYPVEPQLDRVEALGVEPVGANLISETDLVRHDSDRLARTIIDLIARHKTREHRSAREVPKLRAIK